MKTWGELFLPKSMKLQKKKGDSVSYTIQFSDEEIDELIKKFGINTNVKDEVTKDDIKIFSYDKKPYKVYIVETPESILLGAYPSIVNEEFKRLNQGIAKKLVPLLFDLGIIKEEEIGIGTNKTPFVLQHVLRASLGYELHGELRKYLNNLNDPDKKLIETWVRTHYVETSYRDHDEEEKELEIIFEDYKEFERVRGRSIDVIIQDTLASGKTGLKAISKLLEETEKRNIRINRIIFYGFIAEFGSDYLWSKILKPNNIDFVVIALNSLTPLSINGYDMPIYGYDVFAWEKKKELKPIGGVMSRGTFKEMVSVFIPGADQPGDFSARQTKLFTGEKWVPGNIDEHVENTITYIRSIKSLLEKKDKFLWEKTKDRIKEELEKLEELREKY